MPVSHVAQTRKMCLNHNFGYCTCVIKGLIIVCDSSFSQNQPSAKFTVLRQEHLVAIKAKPKLDLLSRRWMCSSLKPCAKRTNATLKRSEPFTYII